MEIYLAIIPIQIQKFRPRNGDFLTDIFKKTPEGSTPNIQGITRSLGYLMSRKTSVTQPSKWYIKSTIVQ